MLFVTFLLLGIALFVIIYLYSVHQLKQQNLSEEVFDPIESKDGFVSKIFGKILWNKKKDSELFDRGESFEKNEPSLDGDNVAKSLTPSNPESAIVDDTTMSIGGVVAKVSSKNIDRETSNNIHDQKTILRKKKATETGAFNAAVSEFSEDPVDDLPKPQIKGNNVDSYDAVPLDQLAQELESSQDNVDSSNVPLQSGVRDDSVYQQDLLLDEPSHIEQTQDSTQNSDSHQALVEESLKEKTDQRDSGFYQSAQTPVKRERSFKASANAIEIVAKISSTSAVPRDECLGLYRRYDYLFTRKLGIFGRNNLTHVWENMELADQSVEFDDIAVSLQLADKSGAMTRKESNTFSTLALEFADKLDKTLALSMDLDDAVEKGRMLDELARKYDAMVVCNIIPKRRKGFRSTDIQSCTRDLQMVQSKNGVFGRFGEVGGNASLRYSLAIAGPDGKYIPVTGKEPFQVEDIVVFLNVPLMKEPVEAFDLMIRDARKLAAWLDGKIVDKNERNMTTRTLDKLAEQIVLLEKEMALDGLIPGSLLCKKLF